MNLEEKLYTSTEVAKILGVSLRSVYRYLDQGKLHAEIKTATGRLRFTKQDILNFLYPNGEVPQDEAVSPDTVSDQLATQDVTETDMSQDTTLDSNVPAESTELPEEEEVDWLERFRAAAQEVSPEESTAPTTTKSSEEVPVEVMSTPEVEPEAEPEPEPEPSMTDSLSSLGSATSVASLEPEEEPEPQTPECLYFKSSLGGLKEIAQNVDKVSRKASVDYAFTLYAGLSLEKPLKKPFSILHLYVDPEAVELYRRLLQLEPASESDAQICLMLPRSKEVLSNKVEKHGLYVVDDDQLEQDFASMGLAEEYKTLV